MSDQKILVVDPDPVSLNYLEYLLRAQKYSVLKSDSGKEGLIYVWRDQPDLVLFDPAIADIPFEEFLQKLRSDTRSARIPILALSNDPSSEKREACLELGSNEYLIKSGEAVIELFEAIERLIGEEKVVVEGNGILIVFSSAKGGTGTSSLCANYAMTICNTKPEAKVVVVDLVLPIGSIAPIVGYEGDVDLVSIAKLPAFKTTGEFFYKQLPEIDLWQFQLLAGATDPARANDLDATRIPEIIQELKSAFDYVVIDLGRSLSRISLPLIQKADLLVLIMSTDQSTITLTRQAWDYLQAQDVDAENVYTILNRAVGLEGITKAEAEEIIGIPIKTAIPFMGTNFALANNLHQPIITKYPNDTAAIVFKDTTNDMIDLASRQHSK